MRLSTIVAILATTLAPAAFAGDTGDAYQFSFLSIDGKQLPMSSFKGKTVLVVNTASQCGFTPQYSQLEKVWQKYKDKGLVVLGVPSNDFGKQEPGTNAQIHEFCTKNYSVTFPMATKISVKGGDMAPIYHWLTEKKYNGFKDSEVKWNFQKYLINEKGQLVDVIAPGTKPTTSEVIQAIERP